MKELVELSIVTALYTIIYNAQNDGGGVYIDFYEGRSGVEFGNCRILKNIDYLGSGLYLHSLNATSTSSSFYFQNVLFHFNKATNNLAVYRKYINLLWYYSTLLMLYLNKLKLVIIT